ncbi:hypothetical protein [Caballeronia sp. BR00000012568055]|uniref:hypothetical protein n=1 Tax=Caballeronia sp. BR00000012568055 TaxID=2918761 RepID=UPI0023F7673E|nr:hypothetical protein [Caballeronia sp. BR00000012568055]
MSHLSQSARRRFGQVSSLIANAAHHVVPQKMPSWKLALYLIVFLLPGGSFAVLGMGWFENRQRRRAAAKPKQTQTLPLLPANCACPGNGGATGA